ncbi:hypothetical protein Tco_1230382, partial [Tanacetum coccineum]
VWLLPKAREASSDTDSLRSASSRTQNRDHQTCRSLSYCLLSLFIVAWL